MKNLVKLMHYSSKLLAVLALTLLPTFGHATEAPTQAPVLLTGEGLTLEQMEAVARHNAPVRIAPEAMRRVELSHKLLLQSAREGKNVYGLTTGVGINKDKVVFTGDVLSPEAREASEKFNARLLRTHAVAIGPEAPEDVVRAALLVRLNKVLRGHSALHPSVTTMYADMLNAGVHPVLPMQGTVGVGDITILSYTGLVMMGEHEAVYKGKRLPGAEALKAAGLTPVRPYAKDGLTILSTNALTSGMAALTILDADRLLTTANVVFAMSLEGLNGNVAPFMAEVQALRPFKPMVDTATNLRAALAGSYLYAPHPKRPMQDPLSFRDTAATHGTVLDSLNNLRELITLDMNTQDDNPAVVVDGKLDTPDQEFFNARYVVKGGDIKGLVLANANFDPLVWVTELERLGISFSHMSRASAQRVLKLASDRFTGLPRNLAQNEGSIGYLTIQKTASVLDAEIRYLSQPVSVDVLPLSGEIEDMGTNAGLVIEHLNKQIDCLYSLLAVEALHGSRAVGLRHVENATLPLGTVSGKLFATVDALVPAVGEDRAQGPDIRNVAEALRTFNK